MLFRSATLPFCKIYKWESKKESSRSSLCKRDEIAMDAVRNVNAWNWRGWDKTESFKIFIDNQNLFEMNKLQGLKLENINLLHHFLLSSSRNEGCHWIISSRQRKFGRICQSGDWSFQPLNCILKTTAAPQSLWDLNTPDVKLSRLKEHSCWLLRWRILT